jgi:hypothetical protein
MKTQQNIFEVLMLDSSGKTEITTEKSLMLALSYSEKLWKNPTINPDHTEMEDKVLGLRLEVRKLDLPAQQQGVVFLVRASSSDASTLESFREKIFVHAEHKLGFGTARILIDTLSESISLALYPLIKSVENALREHLEKALIQKQGLNWWDSIASQEVNQKVSNRTNAELHFKGLVDPRMSLTDFNDLTTFISKSNSIDPATLNKWEALTALRNRVVTHSVFTSQDLNTAEQLCKELMAELGKQYIPLATVPTKQVPQEMSPVEVVSTPVVNIPKAPEVQQEVPQPVKQEFVGTKEETVWAPVEKEKAPAEEKKEVVVEEPQAKVPAPTPIPTPTPVPILETAEASSNTNQRTSNAGSFDMITESVLLQELKVAQGLENGSFVDLKGFVTKTLEPKGYATGAAYLVAKNLNEKGLVQIFDTKNDKGVYVKAIRTN